EVVLDPLRARVAGATGGVPVPLEVVDDRELRVGPVRGPGDVVRLGGEEDPDAALVVVRRPGEVEVVAAGLRVVPDRVVDVDVAAVGLTAEVPLAVVHDEVAEHRGRAVHVPVHGDTGRQGDV